MPEEILQRLREELADQRRFLSEQEAEALLRARDELSPDDPLATVLRRREAEFRSLLRDRFLREGLPVEEWWRLVRKDTLARGKQTLLAEIVLDVLKWQYASFDTAIHVSQLVTTVLGLLVLVAILISAAACVQGQFSLGLPMLAIAAVLWFVRSGLRRWAELRLEERFPSVAASESAPEHGASAPGE
mgnify:CR=1 FL=1